jgi:hypothetical protein
VSTNFIIFGPTDQKFWVFEVFGQGLARVACAIANEEGVDHIRKKWGKKAKKRRGSLIA